MKFIIKPKISFYKNLKYYNFLISFIQKVQLAGVKTGTAQQVVWTRRIAIYYVIHLIFQLSFEILGFVLLNFLQSFQHKGYVYRKWASEKEQTLEAPTAFFSWSYFIVPEEYKCDVREIKGTSSCSLDSEIPCFNPRAFDKTVRMISKNSFGIIKMYFIKKIIRFLDISDVPHHNGSSFNGFATV